MARAIVFMGVFAPRGPRREIFDFGMGQTSSKYRRLVQWDKVAPVQRRKHPLHSPRSLIRSALDLQLSHSKTEQRAAQPNLHRGRVSPTLASRGASGAPTESIFGGVN